MRSVKPFRQENKNKMAPATCLWSNIFVGENFSGIKSSEDVGYILEE